MPKMIEISAAEYERLNDCIREDGLRIAALIEENKALHQDAKHLRENIVKLRRRYPEGFEVARSIGKGEGTVMGDLIDRDALGVGPANPEVFKNTAYADGWNALLRIINQAPVVDAAQVVRCKCCVYGEQYKRMDGENGYYCKHQENTFEYLQNQKKFTPIKGKNDFCSLGKQRKDDK